MKLFCLEDEIGFYPRNQIKKALASHEVHYARSVSEGKLLFRPPYDVLLLDHDMEGHFEQSTHPNTGWRFCEWMVNGKVSPIPTILHSQNHVGAGNMFELLSKFGWKVEMYTFSNEYIKFLEQRYGVGGTHLPKVVG